MHDWFYAKLFWMYLKWLLIALVWGVSAYGLYRENQQMKRPPSPAPDTAALLRMLHQRNLQMWMLVSLLLLICAVNDIRYDMPPPQAVAATDPATPSVASVSTPPTAVSYDNLFDKPSSSHIMPFSDITAFNEKDSQKEAYLDWLKQRYEAWLVTYYYLQKCGKADNGDLALIEGALHRELSAAQAESGVENNILLAATGSYNEMYRDIPCDSEHLARTKTTYDVNMQQITGVTAANKDVSSQKGTASQPQTAQQ